VYTLWKSLNELLGSHNSKTTITLNLHNRRARSISHGVLEVLVETASTHIDWKLKLNGVNITREFKPLYVIEFPELNKYLCKFVYDITGLLNTDEAISREWANLTIKHEGGDSFSLKGLLLNAIYDDPEATSIYSHVTGLLLLEQGEEYTYNLEQFLNSGSLHAKLVLYTPRAGRAKISTESGTEIITLPHSQVEEHVIISSSPVKYIKITPELNEKTPNYIVISSITVYNTQLKTPHLDIESIETSRQESNIRIKLRIVNRGESRPDRVVMSVFNRGVLLGMYKSSGSKYEPGVVVEEEFAVSVPPEISELTLRLAWSKLTKTMFVDKKLFLK